MRNKYSAPLDKPYTSQTIIHGLHSYALTDNGFPVK